MSGTAAMIPAAPRNFTHALARRSNIAVNGKALTQPAKAA
jgi:hypothetical protein